MSNLLHSTSASKLSVSRDSGPFVTAFVKPVLEFWLKHHPPASQNIKNLAEQLCAELEDTYPTISSTRYSPAEHILQEDHRRPHQHDQSSDTLGLSRANQSPELSPALAGFQNQHTRSHFERASSPNMSDITGEEHELPGSDETLIDYVTPVDLVMPSAGVDWDGSSTTACSAYSETAEGPAQESQLEAPHWVKQPSLR